MLGRHGGLAHEIYQICFAPSPFSLKSSLHRRDKRFVSERASGVGLLAQERPVAPAGLRTACGFPPRWPPLRLAPKIQDPAYDSDLAYRANALPRSTRDSPQAPEPAQRGIGFCLYIPQPNPEVRL